MKKLLLIALSGILLVPHAAFAMGAPGALVPSDPSLYKQAIESVTPANPLERGKELLSKISPYCPSGTTMTIGGLAALGCVAVVKTAQASALAQELAIRKEAERKTAELEKQRAFNRIVAQVNNELSQMMSGHAEFFYTKHNGNGFDGWFKLQQEYIVALISNPNLLQQALDPHGALAIRDKTATFVYQQLNDQRLYVYKFSIDTRKSAEVALRHKQLLDGPSQATASSTSSPLLTGRALEDATQQLNPPLVLKFEKNIYGTDSNYMYGELPGEMVKDNLLFTKNSTSSTNPYAISIYEDTTAEAAPTPGWFAGWFTRSKSTPATQGTSGSASSSTGQNPTSSSSATAGTSNPQGAGPASTSSSSTTETTKASEGTSEQVDESSDESTDEQSDRSTPVTKSWWQFWK